MKRLLLVLVPMVLLAQVEVDTVVHLPSFIMNGFFIPELNKLYVLGWYEHYALDCSTYQLRAQIPRSWCQGYGFYSWNWRRHKLYVYVNPLPDSLVVIDGDADSLIRTLPIPGEHVYVASKDRLYIESNASLYELDCATDSVVRTIQVPESGYTYFSTPSWDSVDNKLYVSLSSWSLPPKVAVYDCATDSLRAVIDIPSPYPPFGLHFDYSYHKAYYSINGPGGRAGVIDTQRDTVIKVFPFNASSAFNTGVALDAKDHKAYILGADTTASHGGLYVVDCATDTIVKRLVFPHTPWPVDIARWVPWSNRVYLSRLLASSHQNLGMYVVDCNTDSIIVSNLVLGYYPPFDFQLDPIRERVFAIGTESTSVHVLRDVISGVAETPALGPIPGALFRLGESRDAVELEYHLETPGWVEVAVFDPCGRRVKTLASERQMPGLHDLRWDRTDRYETKVARGAYFVLLNTGSEQVRLKVVVR